MAPKSKSVETFENLFLPPPVDLDHIPLAYKDYKITQKCEFEFFELHFWLKYIFLDHSDEIGLWESNFPLYMFPRTFHFPEFALKCQAHYFPGQRDIVSSSSETLFTVTPKYINQMLQIPKHDPAILFSIKAMKDMYQKLTFPQRAQIFDIFCQKTLNFARTILPIHPPSSLSGPTRSFPFFVTCQDTSQMNGLMNLSQVFCPFFPHKKKLQSNLISVSFQ